MRGFFSNRLIYWILFPVMAMGLLLAFGLLTFALPPFFTHFASRVDNDLRLAAQLSIAVCDKGLDYLHDLRLEDNPEIHSAVREETLAEIRAISHNFEKIQLLVVSSSGQIVTHTAAAPSTEASFPDLETLPEEISRQNFWGDDLRIHLRYFPYWDWLVISYMTESDYQAPLRTARWAVSAAVVGSLALLIVTLLAAFYRFVDRPIKHLMDATTGVAGGQYRRLPSRRDDEIGRLISAFNRMQERLAKKDADLSTMLSALQVSEERFRTLIENAPLGIGLLDGDGCFREGNGALLALIGCPRASLQRVALTDLFNQSHDLEKLRSHLEARTPLRAFDAEIRRLDGSCYNARLTLSHFDIDGEPVTQVLVEDHTVEKELEARLQRAEKMEALGTLAGGVAHDLNNILSAIVGYPDILIMDLPADSPMLASLGAMKQSGERAAAIVQDLLTLARRGVMTNEVVNLNTIVKEYLQTPVHEKICRFHPGIRLETHLGKDLLNVQGSSLHLAKTMMNLVSNAAEAIVGEGCVTITTENRYVDRPLGGFDQVAKGEYATLTVADTGGGIAPEDLERIFEPFFTKKVMGRSGTGLGMAVVWGTVKDHKGYIDLHSKEGEGTAFTLYFPATREVAREKVDFDLNAYKGMGEHLLVVDDVAEQRELASQMLTRLGYRVHTAESGEAAVTFVQTQPVDLVVLDMIMDPGIDGLETYARLSRVQPGIKAIIASGFSQTDRIQAAQELGAGGYLKKPYTLEKLATVIYQELNS